MTKPVTLSEEAFRVLRANKRASESDSDVILRLVASARTKKDPLLLGKVRLDMEWTPEEYDRFHEKMRQADLRKMKSLHPQLWASKKRKR